MIASTKTQEVHIYHYKTADGRIFDDCRKAEAHEKELLKLSVAQAQEKRRSFPQSYFIGLGEASDCIGQWWYLLSNENEFHTLLDSYADMYTYQNDEDRIVNSYPAWIGVAVQSEGDYADSYDIIKATDVLKSLHDFEDTLEEYETLTLNKEI